MYQIVDSKILSYNKVEELLLAQKVIYQDTPEVVKVFDGFFRRNQTIKDLIVKTQMNTRGVTQQKDQYKAETKVQLFLLVVVMVQYANAIQSHDLLSQVKITKGKLNGLNESNLIVFGSQLLSAADAHKENLGPFGGNLELIEEVRTTFNTFYEWQGKPQQIIKQRRVANQELFLAIKDMDQYLENDVEWTMRRFKISHPNWVESYELARKVKARSHQHYDLQGVIRNQETQKFIEFGSVTCVELNKTEKISKKGRFSFKNLPEGELQFRVENMNFHTKTFTIRRYKEQKPKVQWELSPVPIPEQK